MPLEFEKDHEITFKLTVLKILEERRLNYI